MERANILDIIVSTTIPSEYNVIHFDDTRKWSTLLNKKDDDKERMLLTTSTQCKVFSHNEYLPLNSIVGGTLHSTSTMDVLHSIYIQYTKTNMTEHTGIRLNMKISSTTNNFIIKSKYLMLRLSYLHAQKAHVPHCVRVEYFPFFYFPNNQKKTFTSLIFLKKYIMIK